TALAKLDEVRRSILTGGRARLVVVASSANQTAISADVDKLVRDLPADAKPTAQKSTAKSPFTTRVLERHPSKTAPVFVGLYTPSASDGIFENLAPSTGYADATDDGVLDYLASNLYTGHGAHSIFMKTWAAGLAYSNGLHPRIEDAALDYSAER